MKKITLFVLIILINLSSFFITLHAEEEPADQDKAHDEEHRYEITDWLSLAAKVELEQEQRHQIASDGTKSKSDEFSKSLDIEVFIELPDALKGEIALEYDDDNGGFLIDEAIVILKLAETEIEFGKTRLPFGEYFTNFISDSPLNFAEVKAKGLTVSHSLKEDLELSLFTYKGDTKNSSSSSNSIDWGISTEFSPSKSWKIGVDYISDLADADELEFDDNRYARRVAGFSANSLYEFGDFEFSAEYISALDNFREFDDDRNRPRAWNLELSHSASKKMEWALRYAGSKELEDEPRRQYGISGKLHINKKMALSLEYLESDFTKGFAEDIQERSLSKSKDITAQLSISF